MEEVYLNEFKEFLAGTKNCGEITQYRYGLAMKDFNLNQLSQDYINQYVQDKGNNSQVRGAMLSFFEMNKIKLDLPPKPTGRKRKRVIRKVTQDDYERVRKHLYSKSFKDGLVFDLIYQSALRRSEVLTIRINSFNWELMLKDPTKHCQLTIIGKGDKERVVLVNPETAEKIFDWFAKRYDYKDFIHSPTLLFGKMRNRKVWEIVHYGSIEAIGRDIRPHELRHARGTELVRMGIPIHDVKNYLGHSSVATTEIYLHRSQDESIDNIQNTLINQ